MQPIPLAPVDSLAVTTLVDNVTDVLLVDEGPAKRPATAISGHFDVPARFLERGRTGDALRAEHGFSCLVTASASGRSIRVLFDAGRTPDGLVEDMRRLEISPREIDVIVAADDAAAALRARQRALAQRTASLRSEAQRESAPERH